MCEYCKNGKPIISSIKQFKDRIENVVCGIKGHNLFCSAMIQTANGIASPAMADGEIKFCPMCGRKLVEE